MKHYPIQFCGAFVAHCGAPEDGCATTAPKGAEFVAHIPRSEGVCGAFCGAGRPWASVVAQVVENARIARKARIMFGKQP